MNTYYKVTQGDSERVLNQHEARKLLMGSGFGYGQRSPAIQIGRERASVSYRLPYGAVLHVSVRGVK